MSLQVICNENTSPFLKPTDMANKQAKEIPGLNSYSPGSVQQFVYHIPNSLKTALALNLLANRQISNAIVYVKTNFAADELADKLNRAGVSSESFHDNKSQRTKLKNLSNFRDASTSVLVVTDSAASAITVTNVTTVINFDIPVSADTYVRRINYHNTIVDISLKIFSFCDSTEKGHLDNINRATLGEIQVLEHGFA
jgi:ATP-dependent RNA helicase RhlE